MANAFKLAALYKFTKIDQPEVLKTELQILCAEQSINGALILAHEGINGTVAGSEQSISALMNWFCKDSRFDGMEVKYSYADVQPFYRIRLLIKNEIVTMGCPNIDPNGEFQGTYVEPEDWNAIITDPDVLVLDTRNKYEINIGTFSNAVNPQTENFNEFPKYVQDNLAHNKSKKIAMFCTGGIRCEKASTYLVQQGFETVYNLKGGILKYLETVPESTSEWNGECFVFDQRVSVVHGLQKGKCVKCHGCREPLTTEQTEDPRYEFGVSCPYCHDSLSDEKRSKARERNLQINICKERKMVHLGYKHPGHVNKKAKKESKSNDFGAANNISSSDGSGDGGVVAPNEEDESGSLS